MSGSPFEPTRAGMTDSTMLWSGVLVLLVVVFGLGYVTGSLVTNSDTKVVEDSAPLITGVAEPAPVPAPRIAPPRIAPPRIAPPPGALTEEQVNAMTMQEIQQQITIVAKAKNKLNREDDPEQFDRLKYEFDLLMARMRKKP